MDVFFSMFLSPCKKVEASPPSFSCFLHCVSLLLLSPSDPGRLDDEDAVGAEGGGEPVQVDPLGHQVALHKVVLEKEKRTDLISNIFQNERILL